MERAGLTVLVVEDNPVMLKMFLPMLERLGFKEVLTAGNGKEAWERLNREETIHLVISDLVMPRMNGIELLAKLRASERLWETPFIMVTGEENISRLMSSIEVEVDSYIIKPFTPIKLEAEIDRVLERKFNPTPYQVALQEGRRLLAQEEQTELALAALERASGLQALEADPYYFSAIAHQRQGRLEEAKRCLERCLEIKEAYPKAYDLLGLIHRREKNYQQEREVLRRVDKLSPYNVERNLALALACARLGDHQGVREALKVAGRHADHEDLGTFDKIFRIYLQSGMTAEAEVAYRKYIDPTLSNPRLLNKFALLFKAAKSYEPAIFMLERIVRIWRTVKNHDIPPPDMAVYYFNLAAIHLEQANAAVDPAVKQAGYQTAYKLVGKGMDCDLNHQDSVKLYRWLASRVE
ncbi:MAG: response regulator [Desulfobacteraceae bacterium]|nr:response regulator [Desulfobacteraceae bacterium]